jgi:hypothetical protein
MGALLAIILFLLSVLAPTPPMAQTLNRAHLAIYNPLEVGASCNDTTLGAMISVIGGAQATVMITSTDRAGTNCTWSIVNNLTIPSTITLWIPRGSNITVAAGKVLTLAAPPIAEPRAWWTGPGAVVIANEREAKDARECGVTADDSTDNTTVLNACLARWGHVALSPGITRHSGTIVLNPGNILSGAGMSPLYIDAAVASLATFTTVLRYTGAGVAVEASNTDANVINWYGGVRDVLIRSGSGTIGLHLKNIADFSVERVAISGQATSGASCTGFATAGLSLDGFATGTSAMITTRINKAWIQCVAGAGLVGTGVNNVNAISVTNSRIQGNVGIGLTLDVRGRGWYIAGNDIEGNSANQLAINNGEAMVIEGNYFETAQSDAWLTYLKQCKGCIYQGNEHTGNGSGTTTAAVLVGDSAGGFFCQACVIMGNKFQNVGLGVSISGARDLTVRNNYNGPDVTTEIGGDYGNALYLSRQTSTQTTVTLLHQSETVANIGNSATETTMYSVVIPKYTLPHGGSLRVELTGTMNNNSGSSKDLTVKVKLGGTILQTLRWQAIPSAGGARAFLLRHTMASGTSFGTSRQMCNTEGYLGALSSAVDSVVDTAADQRFASCNSSAVGVDSTADQTLVVTWTFSAAHAQTYGAIEMAQTMYLPF